MTRGYQVKTISAVITKKVNAWLASIEDEDLRRVCADEVIVTGGCIASMLLGEEVNDYDLYFRTKDTVRRIAEYYVGRFPNPQKLDIKVEELTDSRGEDRIRILVSSDGVAGELREDQDLSEDFVRSKEPQDQEPYAPVFLSSNAITLANKVQLILRFYGNPDEIHGNFDFVHCMNYYEHRGGMKKITINPKSLESLLCKQLQYNGSVYPVSSIIRTRKFIERGWKINAGQYLKMMLQISELDLTDPTILEEQLTGVDTWYFAELIASLREADPEKVNATYIGAIIDRIF